MDSVLKNYQDELQQQWQEVQQILQPYGNDPVIAQHMANIQDMYQRKLSDVRPKLMVYGLYNAGKSSIINELLGEDKAIVQDKPQTDRVDAYPWNGYELLDTPGVGAPIQHEQVTQKELRDADIVMFVMSTTGSNEKAQNYTRMKDIADAGKKIIIVLNDKDGAMGDRDDEIQQIKVKVAQNMKQVGIQDVESRYCIVVVNAERARMGRVTHEPLLWNMSGMDELSSVILQELRNTNSFTVMRKIVQQIQGELSGIIQHLEGEETEATLQQLNQLLQVLHTKKAEIRKNMTAKIQLKAEIMGQRLPDLIWAEKTKEGQQAVIEGEVEKLNATINGFLQQDIDELSDAVAEVVADIAKQQAVKLEKAKGKQLEVRDVAVPAVTVKDDVDVMQGIQDTISSLVVNDGIGAVATNLAKDVLKTEIGKMIGKTIVGSLFKSAIPLIGPVLTVASLVSTVFGFSNAAHKQEVAQMNAENERARRQAEAEAQARQELQQKCKYMAEDVADQLILAINKALQDVTTTIEAPIREKIAKSKSDTFANTQALQKLRVIDQQYDELRGQLGDRA